MQDLVAKTQEAKAKMVVATDLLACTMLTPPGEWGADIVIGSAQRFGVPMGYGGPHAAFLACANENKRLMPGRIIGGCSADGLVLFFPLPCLVTSLAPLSFCLTLCRYSKHLQIDTCECLSGLWARLIASDKGCVSVCGFGLLSRMAWLCRRQQRCEWQGGTANGHADA